MRTTHSIFVTYPLADSEDGLPVEIRFTFEPYGRHSPIIAFQSARPASTWAEPLPAIISTAIDSWARSYLDDDEGYYRAWDKAADDTERQRESARDMGMIRS